MKGFKEFKKTAAIVAIVAIAVWAVKKIGDAIKKKHPAVSDTYEDVENDGEWPDPDLEEEE